MTGSVASHTVCFQRVRNRPLKKFFIFFFKDSEFNIYTFFFNLPYMGRQSLPEWNASLCFPNLTITTFVLCFVLHFYWSSYFVLHFYYIFFSFILVFVNRPSIALWCKDDPKWKPLIPSTFFRKKRLLLIQ